LSDQTAVSNSLARRIRAEYRAVRYFAQGARNERVLLYQMGKVGSTALSDALVQQGYWVLHIHSLDARTQREALKSYMSRGDIGPPSILYGLVLGKQLARLRGELPILTAVRDPLARDLSYFFQHMAATDEGRALIENGRTGALLDAYLREDYCSCTLGYTLSWFDDELKRFLGVDVYGQPFDTVRGAAEYQRGPFRVLLVRSELGREAKQGAVAEWLGVRSISMRRSNVSAAKTYGTAYREFLAAVSLPDYLVTSVLESKLARHFYSDEERERMFRRWTGRASR
jgi:hypothetical protein